MSSVYAAELPPGTKVGLLTVIGCPFKRTVPWHVECRCECGRLVAPRLAHLLAGMTRSCGCRGWDRKQHAPVVVGARYAKLVVTGGSFGVYPNIKVTCRCDCGVERGFRVNALKTGQVLSCGCYRRGRPVRRKYHQIFGASESRSAEYRVWKNMRERCYRPGSTSYESYGAKGITVCDRWLGRDGFTHFLIDMGRRPGPEYDIDREDSTKGYDPENCRWLPHLLNLQQPRPRRHKTHCVHGHALTLENIRIGSKGERGCQTCHREQEQRRRHQRRKLAS